MLIEQKLARIKNGEQSLTAEPFELCKKGVPKKGIKFTRVPELIFAHVMTWITDVCSHVKIVKVNVCPEIIV